MGPRLLPRGRRRSRAGSTPTSTGRRCAGSTRRTATATWSAPARRPRPSLSEPDADVDRPPRCSARLARCAGRRAGCRRWWPAWSATASWPGPRGVGDVPGERRRRAVPDRLDHQDVHRGAGAAVRDEGAARPRRPGRRICRRGRRTATATVRALLAHVAGHAGRAGRPVVGARPRAARSTTWPRANDGVGRGVRRAPPFHYTNLGYALLGEVVARLRGGTWWDSVRDRILEPLGMERTSYRPGRARAGAERAPVHRRADRGAAPRHRRDGAGRAAVEHGRRPRDVRRVPARRARRRAAQGARSSGRTSRSPARWSAAWTPQHGLGFQLFRGRVRHAGRPHRLDARLHRDLLRRPQAPHRRGGVRQRDRRDARRRPWPTTCSPSSRPASRPWCRPGGRPTEVPDEIREIVGVWHWGTSLLTLTWEGDTLVTRRGGVEAYRHQLRRRPDRRHQRLHARRGAAGRPQRRRQHQPPRPGDVHPHADALRPRRPDPGRAAGVTDETWPSQWIVESWQGDFGFHALDILTLCKVLSLNMISLALC